MENLGFVNPEMREISGAGREYGLEHPRTDFWNSKVPRWKFKSVHNLLDLICF